LDLTRATLNAILKYPYKRGEQGEKSFRKWGAYEDESCDLAFARELMGSSKDRSLEAELMNWADDVTYSVHDMEDFYKAGLIPLDRLRFDPSAKKKFYDAAFSRKDGEPALAVANGRFKREEMEQSFETILATLPIEEPYTGTSEQRCRLRSLTSALIGTYIHEVAIDVVGGPSRALMIDPVREQQVMMGKELTWQYVILNPALGAQQQGHRTIVRGLFQILKEAAEAGRSTIFPVSAREPLARTNSEDDRLRSIVDLIAGMTEQQALQMYQRLAGISLGSVLVNFIR
jgi:dGTPase